MKFPLKRYALFVLLFTLLISCSYLPSSTKQYEEITPMLTVLTNVAQRAIEQGYYDKGEQAVLEYISQKKPQYTKWFEDRGYKIKVSEVADHAVVLICDYGKAVFEDTYCSAGFPDKDHRGKSIPCEFTMTKEEVKQICNTDL